MHQIVNLPPTQLSETAYKSIFLQTIKLISNYSQQQCELTMLFSGLITHECFIGVEVFGCFFLAPFCGITYIDRFCAFEVFLGGKVRKLSIDTKYASGPKSYSTVPSVFFKQFLLRNLGWGLACDLTVTR